MPSEGREHLGRGLRRVGCACHADLEPQELPLLKAPAAAAVPAGAHGADAGNGAGTAAILHGPDRPHQMWFPALRVGWRRLSLSLGDQLGKAVRGTVSVEKIPVGVGQY